MPRSFPEINESTKSLERRKDMQRREQEKTTATSVDTWKKKRDTEVALKKQ